MRSSAPGSGGASGKPGYTECEVGGKAYLEKLEEMSRHSELIRFPEPKEEIRTNNNEAYTSRSLNFFALIA
jgi:hypothetical protein